MSSFCFQVLLALFVSREYGSPTLSRVPHLSPVFLQVPHGDQGIRSGRLVGPGLFERDSAAIAPTEYQWDSIT